MANIDHAQIVDHWSAAHMSVAEYAFQDSDQILLLPLAKPEAAAALDHFKLGGRPHMHLLFARLILDWNILWGAEPEHFQGVSLGFHVERPPATIEEAMPLAIELAVIGPYALDGPGLSIYEYTYTLIGNQAWELIDLP